MKNLSQAKAEVVAICHALIEDRIGLIEGCRQLASLQHDIGVTNDEAFQPFIAVDSETDHLPLGNVRTHCSPDWLAKADKEIQEVTRLYQDSIRIAAAELIKAMRST